VKFVEDFVGVRVSIVGVGPARDQTIVLPRAA
jgi:adenylosuccinate synthase